MPKKKSTLTRIGEEKLEKVKKRAKKQGWLIRDTLDDIVDKGLEGPFEPKA